MKYKVGAILEYKTNKDYRIKVVDYCDPTLYFCIVINSPYKGFNSINTILAYNEDLINKYFKVINNNIILFKFTQ